MRAYEGDKPYIFVSYAHKDSKKVFQIIEQLQKRGYRIWYDEGIEPGTEWPENIAQHLIKSDTFIAFVTENSMNSANCRREINFALSKEKPFLTIILEKTEIPAGMELQISAQQSILKYNYSDENRFYDKIESCSFLEDCKGEVEIDVENAPSQQPQKKAFPILPVILGVCLLAGIAIFLLLPKGQSESKPNQQIVETTVDNQDADKKEETTDDTSDKKEDTTDIASTSNTSVSWVYSINRNDSSLIYTFERGPVISMPLDYDGQIDVVEDTDNDRINFYHKASKDAWEMDGYKGGLLFSLNFSEKKDYLYLPDYQDIGSTADGFYYLSFPTDLQAYFGNERIASQYSELWSQIDYVKQNVRMN
ncbi:MAG: toll/interleukin-1 receptor domain-containing protein [Faecalicoccus sp.]|nr:toll/interleukin-1 receptor domain-containing protein [Faecalicoccus sp.]